MSVALDTSVIVAALLEWHEHHEESFVALDDALARGEVVLPAPALIESYSVMTRLPAPHRLSPNDARTILAGTFDRLTPIVLAGKDVWRLVSTSAERQVAGGRVYDAHIAACVLKARASRFLTWNTRHFTALLRDRCAVVEPGSTS